MDWNNITQLSSLIEKSFFHPFYCSLSRESKRYPKIAFAAPFVGGIDGAVSTMQAVGGIGEASLKGIGNMLAGSVNGDANRLKRGAFQCMGAGVIGLAAMPVVFVRTVRITKGMWTEPQKTSKEQALYYSRLLKA